MRGGWTLDGVMVYCVLCVLQVVGYWMLYRLGLLVLFYCGLLYLSFGLMAVFVWVSGYLGVVLGLVLLYIIDVCWWSWVGWYLH